MIRLAPVALILLSITTVVPQEERFSKNIIVMVDVSGSMHASVKDSMDAFRLITRQPVDEMNLAVIAYAETSAYWDWHKLPDETALQDAEEWLTRVRGGLGDVTKPIEPFTKALKSDKQELSIVLVTDGEFWSPTPDRIISAINRLQEERTSVGKKKAVICCVGVSSIPRKSLVDIAKIGKGGYFRWVKQN